MKITPGSLGHNAEDYELLKSLRQQTIEGPVGPEPGATGEFKYANYADSHLPEDSKGLGTFTYHVNVFFVDIGLEVLEECKPAYGVSGNVISGPQKRPVVKFRHPDINRDLEKCLRSAAVKRLKELGVFNEESFWFDQQIEKRDFRTVVEQILWEDELAELDGKEAPFAEIRRIKADTEARRKIVMDRMRQGGRVVARGGSLDEVMRKVRA
jgi:hypothetical protein